jgi:2',3'-cyclic-nucleotide 2'-phosphodiesterase (5'-nucleotidase family)
LFIPILLQFYVQKSKVFFANASLIMLPLILLGLIPPNVNSISLPWNDINILVVTDVHGWIGSRKRHEPQWDADYGHVISFYEHLKTNQSRDKNLLFLMNGDFVDGTGLSSNPPELLTPILQNMPWDALTVGNHELYRNSTIEHITDSGFAEYWGVKYVTSNVLRLEGSVELGPLGGSRHIIWEGPTAKLLIFGFLYDMIDNSPLVSVEPVRKVIEQQWFTTVLKQEYQAIVCMVHMHATDPLVFVILSKIRSIVGEEIPIQFISGHSHIRAFEFIDNRSTSFEAGHYLDTIGFVSFDIQGTNFQNVFIDASVETLKSIVGVDDIMTDNGTQIQNMIQVAQMKLGLLEKVGCAPNHLILDVDLSHPQSLWRFYMEYVIMEFYFHNSPNVIFIQGSGAFRYDLFQGQILFDDIVTMSPFNDTIYCVTKELQGSYLIQIIKGGGVDSVTPAVPWLTNLPNTIFSSYDIDPEKTYEVFTTTFDLAYITKRLENVTGQSINPEPQRVATTDLWINFIKERWPIQSQCHEPTTPTTPMPLDLIALFVLAFLAMIIGLVIFVRSRQALAGYNRAISITSEKLAEVTDDLAFDDNFTRELI